MPSGDRASAAGASSGKASGVGTLVYLSIGPILWALHLLIVYGTQPLVCQRFPATSIIFVVGATVVLLASSIAMALLARPAARLFRAESRSPADDRFHRRVMRWLAALSSIGIAWAGTAALIVASCQSLR